MNTYNNENDPETCSKCGEIGQQNRMHFSSRKSERFTCQDCWEAVEDSKRAEQKDEGIKTT
jgi:predicted SprT family Zn-dependent metalloprotease